MNILALGDIFGPAGMNAIKLNLPKIIKKNKIDFVVANGENAADDGLGISKRNIKDLIDSGIDVITSGNHIWDKKYMWNYIESETRLLRPANFPLNFPGKGCRIFLSKKKKKICVLNLMTNYFMQKSNNVFKIAKETIRNYRLKKNVDFILVDVHGEFAGEKMAISHLLDGKVTFVFGTHTHIPTADSMILEKGTAYQTDLGMCGDYNSVIGMNKKNYLKRILKIDSKKKNYPETGLATISGAIIKADNDTGLSLSIQPILIGGKLGKK